MQGLGPYFPYPCSLWAYRGGYYGISAYIKHLAEKPEPPRWPSGWFFRLPACSLQQMDFYRNVIRKDFVTERCQF